MINRKNWKLTKVYLEYRQNVKGLCFGSLQVEFTYLKHILEWAGETSFLKADKIRPVLSDYMVTVGLENEGGIFSEMHIKKTLACARRFLTWVIENYPEYRMIKVQWIQTIQPRRLEKAPNVGEAVSLKEIIAIASAPVENLIEERIRAAAVFWFLTGIRIGAFVTLPLKAVEISNRIVYQYPSMGVKTKNGVYGKTTILNIPDLLIVIKNWDEKVRNILSETDYWFAPFKTDTGEIDIKVKIVGQHRETLARKNLKAWLKRIGLPYHSPHKFRHGQHGLARSENLADYKAVSLNVMHKSMKITDETYSRMNDEEIRNRLDNLGLKKEGHFDTKEDTFQLFSEFLDWKRKNENDLFKDV
jgi:site-specific recombinase XerC